MEVDQRALFERYRSLHDDQLRSIALHIDDLSESARDLLKAELAVRRINDLDNYRVAVAADIARINAHREALYRAKEKAIRLKARFSYLVAALGSVFALFMFVLEDDQAGSLFALAVPPALFGLVFAYTFCSKLIWRITLRKERA